jgi:ATP-binding cassette subfamily B protein
MIGRPAVRWRGTPRRRVRFFRTVKKTLRLARLLWPLAKPHKKLLLAGASFGALLVLFRVALPWPLKLIIDELSGAGLGKAGWLVEGAAPGVAVLGAVYVFIALGAALAEYGQRLVLAGLGNRVVHRFRADLFDRVLRLPLAFHEGRETGELLTRVIYDTARLRQGVNGLLTRIFQNLFLFLFTIGVLVWIDLPLALVVALSGVVTLGLMGRSTRRIRRAARRSRKREGRLAALVAEALLGIREWQTFRPGAGADERFGRQNAKSLKEEQKVRRLAAGLLLRVELVLAVAVALILWLGTIAVEAGRLTPGDLVLFVHYTVALYRPYRQFARQAARMGKTFACADRLTRIMAKEPSVADRPGAVPAPELRGDIVFEGVSVRSTRRRRGGRKWVLKDVSLRVRPGERVAILGPNGAGKSTLLRLVLRLADPKRGVIRLDGRDVRDYTVASLREQMSVVFQDSVFFNLTVRENIALGRPDATLEEIEEAARRSRAADLVERLKHGYDTRVRQRGRLFSVGERQRIAVARAVLRDGSVWLLDEPTTGLDAGTAEELVRLLIELTEGRTALWVTHDPMVRSCFDRVIVLSTGRVRFDGTPEQYATWAGRALGRDGGLDLMKSSVGDG